MTQEPPEGLPDQWWMPPTGYSDAIFARRVRDVRKQAEMTQAQLAARMTSAGYKIDNTAISRIESGDRPVSIGEAVHLAGFLGVPLVELVTDPGANTEAEKTHRDRVEAQIAVRALQHQAAEYDKLLTEQKLLYENTVARLQAAQKRLRDLGGELPWNTPGVPGGLGSEVFGPPSIMDKLAEHSIPMTPREDQ